MKKYLSNILIYLAALLGIVAFIALFATPLQSYNEIKDTWSAYNVKAYLGESSGGVQVYKGSFLPVIGFIIPFLMAIFLIIESFKPELNTRLAIINTLFAIFFFLSAVLVLLTKEMFLAVNDFGQTDNIRNGAGPISSAICSGVAGVILLIVSWVPSRKKIDFIERV